MFGVAGNYFLNVSFGQTPINLDPSQIREFTIVQDINKFLPELRMRISDQSGGYTHLSPFDRGMSKVQVITGADINTALTQTYLFDVYRRTPVSEGILRGEYDVVGLLSVPNLFSPLYRRGFNGTVTSTLNTIGSNLSISNFNISSSLNYIKNLVQPNWSNAQFLQHLCENLSSSTYDSNYRCWVSVEHSINNTLNFLSYQEILESGIKWKFSFGDTVYQDVFPIYTYEIVDNYKYLQTLGTRQQSYVYFDYTSSQWVKDTIDITEVPSLTPYYLVDNNDPAIDMQYVYTGMNNPLTKDFYGKVNSIYETRVQSLTKIWISSFGNFDIRPGDLVQVEVPSNPTDAFNYQYSGFWMVERIVLSFGDTLIMKLLLTRSGVTTTNPTTLIPATNVVQGS